MRLRPAALAAAVLSLVVAATPAHAQHCPILNDHIGDAAYLGVVPLWESQVDIVTVNVASGPTTVAVVMQVAALDPDVFTQLGPEWLVAWDVDGTTYDVRTRFAPSLPSGSQYVTRFSVDGVSAGTVPVSLDFATDRITWTIPRALLPDLATPGATFTKFNAITNLFSSTADHATNFWMTYVDQTAGCIPAA